MAGDWIKMRVDLQTHPKVVRILSATMADKFRVIGGLHAVWAIFDTHSVNGVLNGYSPSILDHLIGWEGFSDAMVAVKWLHFDGENLAVPEFEEHNGTSGKRRAEDQKRKKRSRERPESVRNVSADASANEPDKKRTREEIEDIDQKQELPPLPPKRGKSDKGTRLPLDWSPSAELINQVVAESGSLWMRELPKFRDYWTAKPGAGGTKLDWPATFRNWVRRADEQNGTHQRAKFVPKQSRQAAIFETLANDHRHAETADRMARAEHPQRLLAARPLEPGLQPRTGDDPDDVDGVDEGFYTTRHR
jgi:hypothetical protein